MVFCCASSCSRKYTEIKLHGFPKKYTGNVLLIQLFFCEVIRVRITVEKYWKSRIFS